MMVTVKCDDGTAALLCFCECGSIFTLYSKCILTESTPANWIIESASIAFC